MEILDPDLWNDDGTPKRPSSEYMARLQAAQSGVTVYTEPKAQEQWASYARIKRLAREGRAPEIGDIVHYWDDEKALCRAAIVVEADPFSDAATLRVHIPHEAFQDWHADHDEDKAPETWHWPCGEGQ